MESPDSTFEDALEAVDRKLENALKRGREKAQEVAEKEKADRSRVQVNSITNITVCSVLIDGNLGNTVTPKRPSEEKAQRY